MLPPELAGLSLRHSLFLLAAITDLQSLSGFRFANTRSRIAPHWSFASQMLKELSECGAITLRSSGDSLPAWSGVQRPGEPEWHVNDSLARKPHLMTQLTQYARHLTSVPGAEDELYTLWRELAISEAAAYLAHELIDHRFDETWALVAVPALEKGLRRMSVSRMFYFCWLSVRELASRYLRFPSASHTLSEGLVAYIDQRVDRAISERWTIRDWSYTGRRVHSSVAQVFAEQLTNLGAEYLSAVPSRERLRQGDLIPDRPSVRRRSARSQTAGFPS